MNNATVIKISIIFVLVLTLLILINKVNTRTNYQRTITVKGLSEKEVDANLAVWNLNYVVGSNSLPELKNQILSKTTIINNFLKNYNFDENDFTVQRPSIMDKTISSSYEVKDNEMRYFGSHSIMVHTNKVEMFKEALNNSFELILKEGIITSNTYDSYIKYYFTDLNTIKPSMISEATKNARIAAENFAKDSKSKVGKIKKANQGMFSIETAHSELPEKKIVRVIVTVEYFLTD